jgi:acyl carrier protein
MNRDEIKQTVLEIIAVTAPDEDLSKLKDDVRLRDQLDMDSMDFLDIVMELRKRYKIEVPKEDYPNLATLNGCVDYLSPHLTNINYKPAG